MYISFNWCLQKKFKSIFWLFRKPEMCIWSCEIFSLSSRKKKKTETTHENKDSKKLKIVPFKAEKKQKHICTQQQQQQQCRTLTGPLEEHEVLFSTERWRRWVSKHCQSRRPHARLLSHTSTVLTRRCASSCTRVFLIFLIFHLRYGIIY